MRKYAMLKFLFTAMALLLAVGSLALAAGCGGGTTSTATTSAGPVTSFDKTASIMNEFLNSPAAQQTISATDLNKLLTSNPADAPLVIDVRSATDYQQASTSSPGHIPSAINIPFKTIASPDSIAKINAELAKHTNKTIVVHCYTAHTQSIDVPILYDLAKSGKLGSPAPKIEGLDWGMLGYNSVEKPPAYNNTYPLQTAAVQQTSSFPLPSVSGDLIAQAQKVLPNMPGRLNVGADQTVNKKPLSSYTIIDIRSASDYAKGHLPGAINLPYQDLFKKVGDAYPNLAKIDRSKQILVTGDRHDLEEYVAIGLNLLGISQQKSNTGALGFDIATWNNTVGRKFTPADKNSLPTVTGTAPGGSS